MADFNPGYCPPGAYEFWEQERVPTENLQLQVAYIAMIGYADRRHGLRTIQHCISISEITDIGDGAVHLAITMYPTPSTVVPLRATGFDGYLNMFTDRLEKYSVAGCSSTLAYLRPFEPPLDDEIATFLEAC